MFIRRCTQYFRDTNNGHNLNVNGQTKMVYSAFECAKKNYLFDISVKRIKIYGRNNTPFYSLEWSQREHRMIVKRLTEKFVR